MGSTLPPDGGPAAGGDPLWVDKSWWDEMVGPREPSEGEDAAEPESQGDGLEPEAADPELPSGPPAQAPRRRRRMNLAGGADAGLDFPSVAPPRRRRTAPPAVEPPPRRPTSPPAAEPHPRRPTSSPTTEPPRRRRPLTADRRAQPGPPPSPDDQPTDELPVVPAVPPSVDLPGPAVEDGPAEPPAVDLPGPALDDGPAEPPAVDLPGPALDDGPAAPPAVDLPGPADNLPRMPAAADLLAEWAAAPRTGMHTDIGGPPYGVPGHSGRGERDHGAAALPPDVNVPPVDVDKPPVPLPPGDESSIGRGDDLAAWLATRSTLPALDITRGPEHPTAERGATRTGASPPAATPPGATPPGATPPAAAAPRPAPLSDPQRANPPVARPAPPAVPLASRDVLPSEAAGPRPSGTPSRRGRSTPPRSHPPSRPHPAPARDGSWLSSPEMRRRLADVGLVLLALAVIALVGLVLAG